MSLKPSTTPGSVFRVDKFIVPVAARDGFLQAARTAHAFVGAQQGCLQNHLLEQVGGPGEANFASVVEWASQAQMEAAAQAVAAMHAAAGTDPQALRTTLGIRADVASYRSRQSHGH